MRRFEAFAHYVFSLDENMCKTIHDAMKRPMLSSIGVVRREARSDAYEMVWLKLKLPSS
jgi:hypothetical protein